jgi:hypothetical protein
MEARAEAFLEAAGARGAAGEEAWTSSDEPGAIQIRLVNGDINRFEIYLDDEPVQVGAVTQALFRDVAPGLHAVTARGENPTTGSFEATVGVTVTAGEMAKEALELPGLLSESHGEPPSE